ncbi:hypothetical protein N7449_000733 [Penicillium cf. viridicatum]|uniref:Uncharacterized protein n=1 Tax=Penicillium cf. viridicatum TaxID=2972119 RepID=A0A9W9N6F0_9EURO|nr:hypothetical protein N7449_000733 [Penicillium cf. viridicatum]
MKSLIVVVAFVTAAAGLAYGGHNETGYMPGSYPGILPESEVIDLVSTTTDSETFFDTEEHFTSDNDGDIEMEDVSGMAPMHDEDGSDHSSTSVRASGMAPMRDTGGDHTQRRPEQQGVGMASSSRLEEEEDAPCPRPFLLEPETPIERPSNSAMLPISSQDKGKGVLSRSPNAAGSDFDDSTDGSSDEGSEEDLEEDPNEHSGEGSSHNPDGAPGNGESVRRDTQGFITSMPPGFPKGSKNLTDDQIRQIFEFSNSLKAVVDPDHYYYRQRWHLRKASYALLFEEVLHPENPEFPYRFPEKISKHNVGAGWAIKAQHTRNPSFYTAAGTVRKRADRVTRAHRFPDGIFRHTFPDEGQILPQRPPTISGLYTLMRQDVMIPSVDGQWNQENYRVSTSNPEELTANQMRD